MEELLSACGPVPVTISNGPNVMTGNRALSLTHIERAARHQCNRRSTSFADAFAAQPRAVLAREAAALTRADVQVDGAGLRLAGVGARSGDYPAPRT